MVVRLIFHWVICFYRNSWNRNLESRFWSDSMYLYWEQSLTFTKINSSENFSSVPFTITEDLLCLPVTTITNPTLPSKFLSSLLNLFIVSLTLWSLLRLLLNNSLCILSSFFILTKEDVSPTLGQLDKSNLQVLFGIFSWFCFFFFLCPQPFWFHKLLTFGLKEDSRIT